MLLNAVKCLGYSFYHFSVIKGKPTGAGGKIIPPPPPTDTPRLGLIALWIILVFFTTKNIDVNSNPENVH